TRRRRDDVAQRPERSDRVVLVRYHGGGTLRRRRSHCQSVWQRRGGGATLVSWPWDAVRSAAPRCRRRRTRIDRSAPSAVAWSTSPGGRRSAIASRATPSRRPSRATATTSPPDVPIHPTALVDRRATIDPTADLGPYVVVDGPVEIGPRTRVMAHVFLTGRTVIGADNVIH